jgi:hypothetical protein
VGSILDGSAPPGILGHERRARDAATTSHRRPVLILATSQPITVLDLDDKSVHARPARLSSARLNDKPSQIPSGRHFFSVLSSPHSTPTGPAGTSPNASPQIRSCLDDSRPSSRSCHVPVLVRIDLPAPPSSVHVPPLTTFLLTSTPCLTRVGPTSLASLLPGISSRHNDTPSQNLYGSMLVMPVRLLMSRRSRTRLRDLPILDKSRHDCPTCPVLSRQVSSRANHNDFSRHAHNRHVSGSSLYDKPVRAPAPPQPAVSVRRTSSTPVLPVRLAYSDLFSSRSSRYDKSRPD